MSKDLVTAQAAEVAVAVGKSSILAVVKKASPWAAGIIAIAGVSTIVYKVYNREPTTPEQVVAAAEKNLVKAEKRLDKITSAQESLAQEMVELTDAADGIRSSLRSSESVIPAAEATAEASAAE